MNQPEKKDGIPLLGVPGTFMFAMNLGCLGFIIVIFALLASC